MPSGREVHALKPFDPPSLDAQTLQAMRAPPEIPDDFSLDKGSSDEEASGEKKDKSGVIGAFPGTKDQYSGSGSYY